MIMRNQSYEQPDRNVKFFNLILKTAGMFCDLFDVDQSANTARGVFFATGELSQVIVLAYDEPKLFLELRFKPSISPEIIRERFMNYLDKWASLLASVTYEKEDRVSRVRSKTALEPSQNPAHAVRTVFKDLKSIVGDEDFQQLLS